jgi:AraC-like DNA-binding protein
MKVLSTSSIPEAQRLAYWLDTACSLYCRLDCKPPAGQPIFGHIDFGRLGDMQFTRLRSNSVEVSRGQARVAAGNDDHYLVLALRHGLAQVKQDGRVTVLRPGEFVVNDCSRPYVLNFEPPYHEVQVLRFPRIQLDGLVRNAEDLTAIAVPGSGVVGRLLLSMMDALRSGCGELFPACAHGVSQAVAGVVGAALGGLPGAEGGRSSNLRDFHIARIKAFVRERLRDPALSVALVAAAMQLSPDYVGKLFAGEPMPLSRLIWQWRLEACSRELADPRSAARSVSDIAFAWGFSDSAHFSRRFRQHFGMAPKEWRHHQACVLAAAGAAGRQ